MSRFVLLAGLSIISTTALASSADSCPTLPANSGFAWTNQEGPDFDLCYASPSGSGKTVFGIYLGNAPSFDPTRETALGKGIVAGRDVQWYPKDASAFSRQTLLKFDQKHGYVAHIWIIAGTQKELMASLAVLEHITFKQ